MKRLFKILLSLTVLFTVHTSQFAVNAQFFNGGFITNNEQYDSAAQRFIDNAEIVGLVQKRAINQLVLDLKGNGNTTNNTDVWQLMIAIYPFCPTNNAIAKLITYSYNLKTPYIHPDSTFNMTWVNNPQAKVFGVYATNNNNEYGLTNIFPDKNIPLNSAGLTVAISVDTNTNNTRYYDFGCYNTSPNRFFSFINNFSGTAQLLINQADFPNYANTTKIGVFTGSRNLSNEINVYQNGTIFNTKNTLSTNKPNSNLAFMGRYNGTSAQNITNKTYTFAAVHKGLSANNAKDLYDAIIKYNNLINR